MVTLSNSEIETQLVSPGFISDPYPLLRRLREDQPIYWSDAVGGWIMTRYEDIVVSFKQTAYFSNENRLGQALLYLPPEKRAKYTAFADHYATKSLLHSDPPEHTRMRTLVTKEFTPRVVEVMRPRIQMLVDALLDAVEGRGEMNVTTEFAAPLPIGVIAEILGVASADRHLFKVWADALLGFQGVNKPNEGDLAMAQDAIVAMRPYIAKMIEERRAQPSHDLMSKFVAAEAAGDKVTQTELISTVVTLFVAGHETTLSLIANTVLLLLSHPDQLRMLQENPELLEAAIEESLRFESPVSRQPRLMKEDFELDGKLLKRGQMVFQMINSANRDPAYFDNPDKFDISRRKNRHMAFGQGVHVCVGAVLARTEAFVAIGTLIRRFKDMRLKDRVPSWDVTKRNSRVLNALPILLSRP